MPCHLGNNPKREKDYSAFLPAALAFAHRALAAADNFGFFFLGLRAGFAVVADSPRCFAQRFL